MGRAPALLRKVGGLPKIVSQGTDKNDPLGLTHSEAAGPDGPRSLVVTNLSVESNDAD